MMSSPSLPLDQCVETLKNRPRVTSTQPKELARFYLAAIGLVCHLKKDQAHLHGKARKSSNEQSGIVSCPPAQEIPAITRVQQDSQLFHSLLSCLKVPDATDSTRETPRYNRKRSYSFQADADNTPASKMLKIHHSPKKPAMKLGARSAEHHPDLPSIPLPVLAATVLYSAFQHVDHWPAPLVQAYAEDAFGPRLWVDDERCSLLVQNLALSHENLEQEPTVDEATLTQAARVAHYYENLPLQTVTNGSIMVPPRPAAYTPKPNNKRTRSMSIASSEPPASTAAAPPSDSDSDSGDEETCLIEVSSGLLARAGNGGGDDSSSSGEEDAEVVEMSTTLEGGPIAPPSGTASLVSQSVSTTPNPLLSFPAAPTSLNLKRVRQRFFGVNRTHAHKAIATALTERLELKSKQNSKLLMALPSFVCIPAVRRLTTRHLERWLQSPALSGQARALFAATVQHMHNVDPPLPDDVQAIDSIMEMRLKANQLNMHIENVTQIAKGIPNVTVARHIFLRILREEFAIMESGTHPPSPTEPMKMVSAVYGAFPPTLACEALAIAFLTLLAEPVEGQETSYLNQRERQLRVKKIKSLLRSVASVLGSKFDGCGLIESLLSFDVNAQSWSLEDEQDKARLMYECVTLLVPPLSAEESSLRHKGQRKHQRRRSDEKSEEEIAALRSKLKRARKLLLDWCCTEYAQQWQARNQQQTEHDKRVKKRLKRGKDEDVPAGAGTPDYSSALDGQGGSTNFEECLNDMRCVLFMAGAESTILRDFLYPGDSPEVIESVWHNDEYRIQQCYEYGCDLDDEMLWIILKSATLSDGGIDPALALGLIENLFECCNKDRNAFLQITDPKLVWELYRLAEYVPSSPHHDMSAANGHVQNGSKNIPRLAYPGMWWRVTMLALALCGAAPGDIGMEMWNNHPTLRALVKMVTSGRYRFPTIDCDESSRSEMKSSETQMRDEESRIAEILFLPPALAPKKSEVTENGSAPVPRGSRVSSRQREKQERLQRQRREKEAAAALAEANHRKKVLRAAQKSIMLWDPKGPARKPPKEAVPLILSVEQLFCLSEAFQQSTDPDFLLLTIGQTTRGAIERAFDWVIPVISSVPEIISRLPANASCFLLLRAYGEEGEGKSELRKLSSPLVEHVKKSLTGEFGEPSAVRAAELLLVDLADPHPDRRRCVIRVLRETLSHHASGDDDSTGLLCLLQFDHAEAIVSGAIKYISQALSFERGRTLRALVIALDKYISFAAERKIDGPWKLSSILCELISNRTGVCSEAMDRFPDFRALGITLIHHEFLDYANEGNNTNGDAEDMVFIQLCTKPMGNDSATRNVSMPYTLLQSACVLLSICKNEEISDISPTAKAAMQYLADALMYPCDHHDMDNEKLAGLASATVGSGDRAVAVEQWVMLAKSRSAVIARRAALSAPTLFLPRLLLCSGLPPPSLLTMIDRLGKLGDKADDRDLVFKNLVMPSATNQWATLYPANRKELGRKLVGRLSAYLHLNEAPLDKNVSSSFLEWLSEECSSYMKPKRSRTIKKGPKADQTVLGPLLSSASGGLIVSTLSNVDLVEEEDLPELVEGSPVTLEPIQGPPDSGELGEFKDVLDRNAAKTFIDKCYAENCPTALNDWLKAAAQAGIGINNDLSLDIVSVCISLLGVLFDERHNEKAWFRDTVLKWVPALSQLKGEPDLWKLVFSPHSNAKVAADLLRNRCALVWSQPHAKMCQQWILSNYDGLCVPSAVRFLVATSYQPAIHAHSFISSTTTVEDYWGSSESGLKAGVMIAVKCAKEPSIFDVNSPINLPDWVLMLLLLARTSQRSMMIVCEMLLSAFEKEQDLKIRSHLQSAMLRLYTYFPKRMKLGNPKLRGVLIEGAKSGHWLSWRSSLDAQLDDMLTSLKSSPSKRIIQALMDLSKSHPLLVLRKLPGMVQLLEDDARVSKYSNARGRISGENLLGPLGASISGKPVKVTVRHWGYSFTESLWISLLDVLMSVPKEVLFSCGLPMGLGELLGVYSKLLFIQCQLKSNPARVKSKFSDVINKFKTTDAKGWESWLTTKQPELPSLDNTRNVLMSCSLIDMPETSVEALRRAMQS